MNRRLTSSIHIISLTVILLLCLTASPALAQGEKSATQQTSSTNEEKAEAVIKRAIEVMGGASYLNVRSVVSRGQFTQFKEGLSGLPSSFIDYLIFPDRERTDFKNPEGKVIQTNDKDKGWIYDGAAKSIKEMTKAQVEDFKLSMRASVDNLLRGFWRNDGAKLSYVGRREAGLARRNETVRLTYTDGYTVEFEFDAKDSLPMKILYKRKNAEGAETAEEDRMGQHVKVGGVIFPFVIDHYSAGAQTSRINYQSVEVNSTVPDSLFARPANIKGVK
ncbi:MAG: hypothetical protein DMF68_19590 [Acidobacteria bacterium]|nr:MAG: hypothetical protein DMF68_19590 [Acidobacteriota bacterium]